MKKALLFAILALSVNAYTQSKQPLLISPENDQGIIGNKEWKTSNIYSEKNFKQTIKHQTPHERSVIQIYDSIYQWQWDEVSIGWKIYSKTTDMVYDANNNQTSYIWQWWYINAWVGGVKHIYTYDANNNITSELVQGWNDSVWLDRNQIIYSYDASNNMTSELWQFWDGSAWDFGFENTYTYDASNNMTISIVTDWLSGITGKGIYTYDGSNNLISYILQIGGGSAWENNMQFIYTYDASNNRTSELCQEWHTSVWENFQFHTYVYDANNNLTKDLYHYWDGSAWKKYGQYTYTYDVNNFTISDSYKYWNGDGTIIESGDSTHYYFHTALGIDDLMLPKESVSVYPNPCNGRFVIGSNSTINSIEIYNLPGELIYSDYQVNRQTTVKLDLSDQVKGIYFIRIYSGTKIYTRKIAVQ